MKLKSSRKNSVLISTLVCVITAFSYADDTYTPTIPTQQEQQQYFANAKAYGKNFNNSESSIQFQKNQDIKSGVKTSFVASQKAGANITLGESILNNNGGNFDNNGNPTNNSKNNYSQSKSNPVFQYNSAQDQIAKCRSSKFAPGSEESAACNAVNRYTDDDFRRNLDAYHQDGFNYWNQKLISPDPNNSTCSIVKSWTPINPKDSICLVGRRTTPICQSSLTAWREDVFDPAIPPDGTILASQNTSVPWSTKNQYKCDPTTGECNQYINDKTCKIIQNYVAPTCTQYSYSTNYGNCSVGTASCNMPSSFKTPGCNGSGGRVYNCGSCSTGGDFGDHNSCWNQKCTAYTQMTPAIYECSTSGTLTLSANAVSYTAKTSAGQVLLNVSANFLSVNTNGAPNQNMITGSTIVANNSGSYLGKSVTLPISVNSGSCSGTNCNLVVSSSPTYAGAATVTARVTLNYTKPIAASSHTQDHYEYSDGCSSYKGK
jgi:hypothetical protein